MPRYRDALPQLSGDLFMTDGGLESTLVFHHGIDLPEFAAFHVLKEPSGEQLLIDYHKKYLEIARRYEIGMILDTVTWRANPDWGRRLGYSPEQLEAINGQSADQLIAFRDEFATEKVPMVISGCLGPRGDGYLSCNQMSAGEAQRYHATQIETLRQTKVDMISAYTLNYIEECVGITRAAQAADLPVMISITVETDGRLPAGQPLGEAIRKIDELTDQGPAYYTINCAHPTHFHDLFRDDEPWTERLGGLRPNSSRLSHEELDTMEELDEGNPEELGQQVREVRDSLANLNVLGGCCGTDHRHVEEIIKAALA